MSDPVVRRFEQGPILPKGVIGLPLIAGAFAIVGLWLQGDPLVELGHWLILAAVVLGIGLVAALAVGPQSMKRVRVDERGLHVKGELALPAHRVGRVRALRGTNAATQSWPLSRNRGLKMPSKQNLYGGLYGFGPAVGIEEVDRDGQRLSSWLIPTRDPQGLAAALEHARDHARERR